MVKLLTFSFILNLTIGQLVILIVFIMNEANKMRLFFVAMLYFYILLHVFAYSPEWISSFTRWISSSHTFVYKDVESSLPGYGDRLWIITKKKNEMKFEYKSKDGERESVLASGECIKMKFGELRSLVPNTIIKGRGVVNKETEIWLLGPIENYDANRKVYGILVPSTGYLYMNDSPYSEGEFLELCKLERIEYQ